MNQKILKLADLSNVKVRDTIWTFEHGNVEVSLVKNGSFYPIVAGTYSYTTDGKRSVLDKYPTAFTKNPFEETFSERWMLVSNDTKKWFKRKVFAEKSEGYVAWEGETENRVEHTVLTEYWNFAKEIEDEEKTVTIEEIAEKFGVKAHNLKIKFS